MAKGTLQHGTNVLSFRLNDGLRKVLEETRILHMRTSNGETIPTSTHIVKLALCCLHECLIDYEQLHHLSASQYPIAAIVKRADERLQQCEE